MLVFGKKDTSYILLFLPIYSSEAGGEFGAVCFVVSYTLTTLSVSRTSLFRARAIYVIMRTGHIIEIYTSYKKDTSYKKVQAIKKYKL